MRCKKLFTPFFSRKSCEAFEVFLPDAGTRQDALPFFWCAVMIEQERQNPCEICGLVLKVDGEMLLFVENLAARPCIGKCLDAVNLMDDSLVL